MELQIAQRKSGVLYFPTVLVAVSLCGVVKAQTDLSIESLEVTQSTQRGDNSVPGVVRRATTVRMFVNVSTYPPGPVSDVQGRLRVYEGSTLLHEMLADNGPITAPMAPDRDNENDTLNFTFIPESAGTLTIVAIVDPLDDIDELSETNNEKTMDKYFSCRMAPSLFGLPIHYHPAGESDYGTPDPSLIAPGVGDAFIWGAYPFPEHTPGGHGKYRIADGPPLKWTMNVDASWISLLIALETYRAAMKSECEMADYLYGWLPGNPFSKNGAAYRPGRAAFGNTEPSRHQRTYAHELGHNFGFKHYEFGTYIVETGWDCLDLLGLGHVKPPTPMLYELMVPGKLTAQAWVHPAHYEAVYADNTSPCLAVPHPCLAAEPVSFLLLTGFIPSSGPWRFGLSMEFASVREPIQPVLNGRASIRMIDASGRESYVTAFEPMATLDFEEEPGESGFALHVPALRETERIELRAGGKLQDVIERSPHAPEVRITSPVQGQTLDGDMEIAWQASDDDDDELQAVVRYSHDQGETFIPLGVDPGGSSLRVSAAELPSSVDGLVQVLVSDGLNTTMAEVAGLRIGSNRPPRVHIYRPREGASVREGANVILLGSVHDAEDQTVPSQAIRWFSDLNGFLGSGRLLNRSDLSAGRHVLDLVAEDSEGARAVDSVVLDVRSPAFTPMFQRGDADADGKYDLTDGISILNYLFLGGREPSCLDAADIDDSGALDISDAVGTFGFLFLGGDVPGDPGPFTCGSDPTLDDELDCALYPHCP